MSGFDEITDDEFDGILENIVEGMLASEIIAIILAIPEVRSFLQEELNNEVLSTWAKANNRCEICGEKMNEDGECNEC